MMKDTTQGQTNHCPMCEDAAKRIEELECKVAMLVEKLDSIHDLVWNRESTQLNYKETMEVLRIAMSGLKPTAAQSSAWLNKKHVEWMKSLPVVLTCTVRELQGNESIPSFDLRWSNNRPISGSFVAIPSDKD